MPCRRTNVSTHRGVRSWLRILLVAGLLFPVHVTVADDAMVLRAMPHIARGVPYFYEEFHDDIQVVTERMVDKIDPPRFFPLIGPAQLHHCHWKCTVYYNETIETGYPFPVRCRRPRVEVVYIDKDHLHLCVTQPDAQQAVIRDMTSVRP